MTCNVGDRLQFHDYTGRPNFRGLLRRRPDRPRVLRCRSCKRPRVAAHGSEAAEEFPGIRAIRYRTARQRRAGGQPGQCSRPHLGGAVAELSFERSAEGGRIGEAEVLGNSRDGLRRCSVRQDGMRLQQPLALNISGHTADAFEQPIEIGAGHPDEPTQGPRTQGGGPQVAADGPPHALLAAQIDLRFGDSHPLL